MSDKPGDGNGADGRRHGSVEPARERSSRAWLFGLAGALVALVIATIVVVGLLNTGSHDPDVVPGINESTAELLQLDTSEQVDVTAPGFSVTDQEGRPMSLAQFRGRPVVLTFNDDKCDDLCTLLAEDVLAADRDLGKARSTIAFVSLNANPYYPSTDTVKEWTDQHGLGHTANWYYGTASPAALTRIADEYGVPIELDAKNKTVEHGTEIFFIDSLGKEIRLGEFGTESADVDEFGHAMAQMADDLLPADQRTSIAGDKVVPPDAGSTGLGSTPAPIALPELADPSATVSTSAYRGKYTVINFWASDCTACVGEMPALAAENAAFAGKVAFVGIDVADRTATGRAFAKTFGITYPLLADVDGAVAGRFAISGLPYTVILDPAGQILVRHPGAFTREQLDYVLRSLEMDGTAAQ